MKRVLISLALIIMLLSLAIAAQTQDNTSAINLMVTQRGVDVEFFSTDTEGVYDLYIYEVGPNSVYMMDTPNLFAGSLSNAMFTASWSGAALQVENVLMQFQLPDDTGEGYAILNLSAPFYNANDDELFYSVTVTDVVFLGGDGKDETVPDYAESATLFIPFDETTIAALSDAAEALGLRPGPSSNTNCSPISPSCASTDGETATEEAEVTETPTPTPTPES